MTVPLTLLFWRALIALAAFGLVSSFVFLFLAIVAAVRFKRRSESRQRDALSFPADQLPPVTIFKPVHGMEEHLEENLESFFQQDYPNYEMIIGARTADDPAILLAKKIAQRYPRIKTRLLASGPPEWPNAKVFTLDKMIPLSRNDFFVISDSDVRVDQDFLRNVIPPLFDRKLGLVTCLYRGDPASDFWSFLEALGMSVEMPSGVVTADMLEGIRFALGPAVALRRDSLHAIGGIRSTADYYSDDYVLGNKIWAAGYKVIFSHYFIHHVLTPRSFARTLGDQLRWMKSTRHSRPWGHIGSGLTFAMPFGLLGFIAAAALGHWGLGLSFLAAAFANRVIQSLVIGWWLMKDRRALRFCWLYPVRDLQGFGVWVASFLSHTFYWRGEIYRFTKDGRIIAQTRKTSPAPVVSEI
ncbi:MAG TPA: glycosyltransferase [Terriglobales bacterium]|jgi:ceramide glucosyltransferase|nr:glycosyltransferase [Terriglobales bacterium]